MALIVLSVVEQRLDAVRAVLAGAEVTEVAAQVGVHRMTVHRWVGRYLAEQVGGLADRSHRPASCPHQAPEPVEVRGGRDAAQAIRGGGRGGSGMELLRKPVEGVVVPSTATINRILTRQGLLQPRPRKRPRDSAVVLGIVLTLIGFGMRAPAPATSAT